MRIYISLTIAVWMSAAAAAQDFQVGARAKGMGGSYTAFEDDPVAIWMNPAGIATQPQSMTIIYQSFTQYELTEEFGVQPEMGLTSPVLIPSFLGFVFPVGGADNRWAVGVGYMRPVHLHLVYDQDIGGDDGNDQAELIEDQEFSRFRTAVAYDFRFRPVGDVGWFNHISAAFTWDIGYTEWKESSIGVNTTTEINSDRRTQITHAFGIIVGVYDNTEDLKVNFGLAVNLPFRFAFQKSQGETPVFDWPMLINVGATAFCLKHMPLRLTIDLQFINWASAAGDSELPNRDSIRDVVNFSFGGEYKYKVEDDGSMIIYFRGGYRHTQAMWTNKNNLTAIGQNILAIDTKAGDGAWDVLTWGFGLYWTTPDGKSRGIDFGNETGQIFGLGPDSNSVAFGYTHEF